MIEWDLFTLIPLLSIYPSSCLTAVTTFDLKGVVCTHCWHGRGSPLSHTPAHPHYRLSFSIYEVYNKAWQEGKWSWFTLLKSTTIINTVWINNAWCTAREKKKSLQCCYTTEPITHCLGGCVSLVFMAKTHSVHLFFYVCAKKKKVVGVIRYPLICRFSLRNSEKR